MKIICYKLMPRNDLPLISMTPHVSISPKAKQIDKSFKLLNEYTYAKNDTLRLSLANHRFISELLLPLVEDLAALITRQSGGGELNPDLLEPHVYLGIGWAYIFERLKRMTSEVCRLVDLWYSDPNNGKEAEDELSKEVLQLLKTALHNVYVVPLEE